MATSEKAAANKTSSSKLFFPGQKIEHKESYESVIFSGKINSYGLTVGHIGKGTSVELHDASDKDVIAEIVETIKATIKTQDEEYTADISFLKMNRCCWVRNILRCADRSTGNSVGEYRLVLHKERIYPGDVVMVLDEQGFMEQEKIKSSYFNCKCNKTGKEVINALCIVNENNHAIAHHGQSGTLVTSCPEPGPDVLRVYGIVTDILVNRDTSATIANRLWDVLRVHHGSGQYPIVKLGETLESINFAED